MMLKKMLQELLFFNFYYNMKNKIKYGFFGIYDILKYKRSLEENEIDHAKLIIKKIFDSKISEFKKSMNTSKLIVDCILLHMENIALKKPKFMIDFSFRIFNAFKNKK